MNIQIKRIYDAPAKTDGLRILVDRLWPRGVSKDNADVDIWLKDIAPSTALRKWFGHDPKKWAAFKEKYKQELDASHMLEQLKTEVKGHSKITLLYAAKDTEHNNAMALQMLIGNS